MLDKPRKSTENIKTSLCTKSHRDRSSVVRGKRTRSQVRSFPFSKNVENYGCAARRAPWASIAHTQPDRIEQPPMRQKYVWIITHSMLLLQTDLFFH